ncbi:MAG: preprotein translocase subunit YajC [Sphingobium sp.]|jgi:preprotein translocase subunit YajC|uniref:Sec translocon accessory complex subunit YajC n=1 Tax=Sphingobium xenophagum TaxID=121428 RepID=A0A249MS21_SPHXE|nr:MULTISPECIES: preprotein translocase subunit YajC [Sphingobium]MBU0660205.1 preprotein translocase subunit YajC [Alphaproteobacteria bacterium]ASY44160.1 preprotein translocase subunit YajC [Sphingobium xenophagum]MBA4755342.1 preprotein translocase subunit YajC [Sphingobium sp.]MBG6118591.1 preprotein translocase subunit YajC [Sphingobium sp. JAI105]MBS89979.1 preprotein translocase subunit YajC [Sphingobium sp.]|tara:strand:+ start:4029 stop:4364 length:336 start_codon:yes stop_codon:yes gene_type:complete
MFISTAFAQTAGGPASGSGILVQMAPLVLIFVVFYFLLIRPQQKRMKAHKAKIDAVKKGDQVITGGGLLGKVTRVDEIYAEVEIAPGMKVKAVKSTLTDVLDPTTAKPAND